jgi:carotenoid cleavage dioxygenase
MPMVHDCAITASKVVLMDLPCILDMEAAMSGEPLPYRWHPEYGARLGLLPRDGGADDVHWFEIDLCYIFHPLNAYDRPDGSVVFDAVRHPAMFDRVHLGPDEGPTTLDRWILHPESGSVSHDRIDDRYQEFPRHDERLIGRPYRYGYGAEIRPGFEHGSALKHDLESGTTLEHDFGPGRMTLEPVFVPVSDTAAEDDGYVLSYVYDATTGTSDVVILHAQDFAGEPLATIHLPRRVPFGFHGNWVPDAEA